MNRVDELAEAQRLAHIGSWYWDTATDETTASHELCRIFGCAVMLPFAQQCGTLYSGSTWQQLNAAVQETMQTGSAFILELPAMRQDKTPIWIIVRGEPVRNADGKIVALRGTVQDISERIHAEEHSRFQATLLNAIGQAVIATDTEGRINYLNHAAENLYGWKAAEASGRSIVEVTVPDMSRQQATEIMAQLTEGHSWSGEFFVQHQDGSIFPVDIHDSPVFDLAGKLVGIIGVSTDISARRKTDTALRDSKRLLDFTMKLGNMGGWELNLADHSAKHTLEHDRIFGFETLLPEWNYDAFIKHVLAEDRVSVERSFHEAIAKQTDWNIECRICRADGEVRWILIAGEHQCDQHGTMNHMHGIVRDITERKRFDQILLDKNLELERATLIAEKSSLAKSDFISSMSHELRTPLNAILGFTQLLENGTPVPTDTQNKRLQQISKAGWFLLELINEILDLSVIESGKLSLQIEPVQLAIVIRDCQSMIDTQAKNRGIQVNFIPCDHTWLAVADSTRLKQVLVNLLTNAIKYNRKQGTVEVNCTAVAADRIRITISDNGMGLSAEKLQQLFQPFNRLGQERHNEEGTGIGLVVARRLVELMGGSIGVESTVGAGSQFWIELARSAAPQAAAKEIISAHPGPASRESTRAERAKFTLLYVEDNPANLLLVEHIIEERPHISLLTAQDGDTGIALAHAHLPHVILMDINLPGISGTEAMKTLRNDPATKHIPVIALSANAMLYDIKKGIDDGFFRYLTKPIRINEFMNALDNALMFSDVEIDNLTEGEKIT